MRKIKQRNLNGTLSIKVIESNEDFKGMLQRNSGVNPQYNINNGRLEIIFDGVDVLYVVNEPHVTLAVKLDFADGGGLFEI